MNSTHTQSDAGPALSEIDWFADRFKAVTDNIGVAIQGKPDVIGLTVLCLISGGHVLIEDVPGVGKTLLAKSLARSLDSQFNRLQFTPDLLPSDVTGVSVFDREKGDFVFRPGPVFASIVLGDEINRASPKTQSALLEAMEERQVTVDAITRPLPRPFMVIATQNPIEHEGTYPLPEAQLDRFMMRLVVGYPERSKELEMLDAHANDTTASELSPVVTAEDIEKMAEVARSIHVSDAVKGYVVDLAEATRADPDLLLGASPRSSLYLQRAARTRAAIEGRAFVTPDDIKEIILPVLTHRLILRPEAQMRGVQIEKILEAITQGVPVPGTIA
ncbi:MAG: MoxR family ATPase [Acidimicrobiia bacterium]|nr:MoxR family ATPase [Acidimicrobiia bacterium]MDH3470254.1 MoxR family ATPase [Acidimicrobiia bacterium]